MSDRTFHRGIYYFDVAAMLLAAVVLMGRIFVQDSIASVPLARDVSGFWIPLLAIALLVAFRRRAYTETRPLVAGAFAALILVATTAIFWRWSIAIFMAAIGCTAILLLVGFILRTRRALEPIARSDLFKAVLGIAGICIGVALAEAILRVAPGLFNQEIQRVLRALPGGGVTHSYIGYLHTPNKTIELSGTDFHAVHHVDGLGFRNRWPWPDRAEIVAVGDSVTFGYGVADEQTWPSLLERLGSGDRVVNLALFGAGPQQYLRLFETFGVGLRPKLVIVGLFARNDFWDARVFDEWLESAMGGNFAVWRDFGARRQVTLDARHPHQSLKNLWRWGIFPVLRSSYLYSAMRALRGGVEGEPYPAPRRFCFQNGACVQLLDGDFIHRTAGSQPPRREFGLLLDSLQQIQSLAARHGARVLVVLQPGKEEVHLPLLGEGTRDPTSALRPAMDRLGIEYLDLAPAFRTRAAAGEALFFDIDTHPNQAGQALIAAVIAAHLASNADRYGLATPHARP